MGSFRWHEGKLSRDERWQSLGQKGGTLWLTGLSGSGKSTIAVALEQAVVAAGKHAYRLDGDNLRHGLCQDLTLSAADRRENVRRAAEVAKLLADSGTVAIACLISPYAAGRDAARQVHQKDGLTFLEVFVDTPLEVCEARDPKGLYKQARAGQLTGMTGVDDPYEPPVAAELVLKTAEKSLEACVEACLELLRSRGLI